VQKNFKRMNTSRGMALIVVIAVFAVVTVMAAGWVRSVMLEHRLTRLHAERAQARWLAEAGVRRAAARRAADANYDGETWHVDASDLGGKKAGEVVLHVTVPDDGVAAGQLRLVAEARYPAERAAAVRSTKTVFFSPND
jgi:Tfp pilus assembly protein PilX